MAITYYGSKLSDNIILTPAVGEIGKPGDPDYHPGIPGFIICKDVPVARTGFQRYRVRDLQQEEARNLGVNLENQDAFIDLYRAPEEVFDPATIASFEGMPVTDGHPEEFVARDTWRAVACGHAQNVRKGWEALESGEWPLIADLVINADPLATNVELARKRQVSCAYNYGLAREGSKLLQVKIRGNHVAVVDKGRAGPEAAIQDGAEEAEVTTAQLPSTELEAKPVIRPAERKENKIMNFRKHLVGLGLKSFLSNNPEMEPEQMTDAAKAAYALDSEEETEEERKKARDAEESKKKDEEMKAKDEAEEKEKKREEDRRAKDAAEAEEKEKKEKEAKDAADKKAKDEAEKSHFSPCKVKDCMARDCRMHGALDDALAAHPEEDDKDMNELQELMSSHAAAPATEEHDAAASEVIEPVSEGETTGDAADAAAKDEAELANERAYLRRMRPIIARAVDSAPAGPAKEAARAKMNEFNVRLARFTRKSKASDATYSGFSSAAAQARTRKPGGQGGDADYGAIKRAYDARLKGEDHKEVTK